MFKSIILHPVVRISKSFLKTSFIYTISGMLPMASGIILIPLYVANLSEAQFGAWTIFMSFSLFMQLVVTYSFDTSLYIHYHEYKADVKKLSSYVSSAFVMMLLISLVVSFLLFAFGGLIFSVIFSQENVSFYPYGWLALGGGSFQALFKVYNNLLQSREQPITFLWSNAVLFMGIILLTILGLHIFPQSLMGPLGARFIALMLGASWVLYRIYKEFGIHFNWPLLNSSFNFNLYSYIYQLQQWLINYFDRILMAYFLTLPLIGVYGFTMSCLIGIELLMNGMHSSFYPKVVKEVMAQTVKESTLTVNRYYYGLVAFVMLLVCGTILVLPFLVEWLVWYTGKLHYMDSIVFIPFIAAFYLLKSVRLFFSSPYGILKFTKPLPSIYTVAVIIKIAGIVLLVQRFGIMGVIIASLLSMATEILLLYNAVKAQFKFRFNVYKMVGAPLLLLAIIIISESFLPSAWQLLMHLAYCIICLMILLWAYRLEIKQFNPFRLIK